MQADLDAVKAILERTKDQEMSDSDLDELRAAKEKLTNSAQYTKDLIIVPLLLCHNPPRHKLPRFRQGTLLLDSVWNTPRPKPVTFNITITAGSNMSDAEIDRAVKEAAEFEAQDKKPDSSW